MIRLATMCNGTTDDDPHGEWACLAYCQGQRVLTIGGNGGLLLVGVTGSSTTTLTYLLHGAESFLRS